VIINIQDITICQGDSFLAGGEYQTMAGVYFDTIAATGGCDSISVTNLIVVPTVAVNTQITICEGDSVFAGGGFQTQAGTYVDTLTSLAVRSLLEDGLAVAFVPHAPVGVMPSPAGLYGLAALRAASS
jgi:hypothetical protein